jgi:hypothetical protein
MKAFILGVLATIVIACLAAFISSNVNPSAQQAYQAHDGSVRLSDR